ncbi:19689_t:CDS:2 [Entrophospora sp. SA101]|nr:19689_t:CDS:2 [Entrophospora sp. SA101]
MYIHNLAHSLIIDPNDENQNVFMKEELQEIKEFKIKQPQASLHAQDNIVDLRKWINHSEAFNENFERLKHFDYDWVKNTCLQFTNIIEVSSIEDNIDSSQMKILSGQTNDDDDGSLTSNSYSPSIPSLASRCKSILNNKSAEFQSNQTFLKFP